MPVFLLLTLIISCGSGPESAAPPEPEPVAQVSTPVQEIPPPQPVQPPPPPEPVVQAPPPEQTGFDSGSISRETFETTKAEITKLVEELNGIIRSRNYNSWLTYLSEDYRREINSREFRDDLVEKFPAFRGRINNARDYFTNVVVPSRANDHVDDIEFVSENQVKAYTIIVTRDNQQQRVILYNLELIEGKWQIIN